MKMHDRQADLDVRLVREMVATQFPRLAGLPITAVRSMGTVNALFRIGDLLYARLPLMEDSIGGLDRERKWLPRLASHLPLAVPEPVAQGQPTAFYPFRWAIYTWTEGEPYADALIADEARAAEDLARFVLELRGIDPAGVPTAGCQPLRHLDASTRTAIEGS